MYDIQLNQGKSQFPFSIRFYKTLQFVIVLSSYYTQN